MSSDRPSKPGNEPQLPSIPIQEILTAAEELGPKSRLRAVLVMLAQKIDKGFAATLFWMRETRTKLSSLAKQNDATAKMVEDMKAEVASMNERIAALNSWRTEVTAENRGTEKGRQEGLREASGKFELVRMQEREEIAKEQKEEAKEEKKQRFELAKAKIPLLVALVTMVSSAFTLLLKWLLE